MNGFRLQLALFLFICGITINLGAQNFQESTLIIKLKPEYRLLFENGNPDQAELVEIWKKFEFQMPRNLFPNQDQNIEIGQVDVSVLFEVKYNNNYSPIKLSALLNRTNYFEYVEPRYIGELAFVPNDSRYGQQSYLLAIGAEQAWDSTQGSSSILIGLLDGGVDTNHEDFKGKYHLNLADPINGIDDDSDGYIDNLKGWNFDLKNDNIQYSSTSHGVQMSGAMAPSTHNSKGIAGVGFKSQILPVVVTNSGSQVAYGYEGIKYAADMGCKVINCSWNIKAYSEFGFDMVKYATLNKGALVVAAVGNESSDDNNYPAMYPYVLGVSAVDNNGFKVSTSNYSYASNISAPGLQILTTDKDNKYIRNTGTSLSSAIVSGAAALLIDQFPSKSPMEIASILKATAKSIYDNGQNGQYLGRLGSGMLHIGNAVTYNGEAYPELVATSVSDNGNGALESNDTVEVIIDVANYLSNSGTVTAIIESENLYSDVLVGTRNLGVINKNDTVSNTSNPFRVHIKSNAPQNGKLDFSLKLIENGDTNIFGFAFRVNTAYQIIETSKIKTALGNRGTFGWYLYSQKEGVGFTYKGGSQLLYEGGLMIGINSGGTDVVDRIRGIRDVEQTDFSTILALTKRNENGIPFSMSGVFTDTTSKDNEIGLIVSQRVLAWPGETSRENFMILEYTIKSAYNFSLNGIYVGLLADWDIEDFDKNRADYDGFRYLAYTHSTEGLGPHCGIQLLNNHEKRKIYSVDHINGGGGGVDLTDNDVFSKKEKYTTLSTIREKAGTQSGGNDVLQIISAGPYSIRSSDSLVFQFAVLAADSLADLQAAADTAFWLINNRLPDGINEQIQADNSVKVYPNPGSDKVNIDFNEELTGSLKLFSVNGNILMSKEFDHQNMLQIDIEKLEVGSYYLKVETANKSVVKKLVKQ